MASTDAERTGGVVRHSDNETQAGAAGRVDGADLANRAETREAPKPRPVEFGWDFPFDSPKPKR